ncbi:hypothetical protein AGMMS50239_25100 [Bacteroidia bacterium]|nr:hypothetical protein AGMMS50239_25100 [Bacteroidia bacterium]
MTKKESPRENPRTQRIRRGVARNAPTRNAPTRTFLAYIILFITLALAPLAAHADMPPSQTGQPYHGVDFAALTNPANKVYYGQYKHRTSPSARDSETRPVLWRTMGEEASDGKLSLFSEYVLDNHTFHGTSVNGSNYYPNSDIHKWLDVAFRDEIFSATEYSSAADPEIVTGIHHAITGNPITGSYSVDGYTYPSALPWRIAVSRIYLPWSIFGLTNAGVYWTAGNNAPSGRLGTSAESIGTYRNGTTVAYWTRTAAYNNATQVLNVTTNGSIVSPGTTATSLLGVRPAFKIKPTEVLFASEIKTSANTANGETNADGTNYAAPAAGTKNFKLTILNSALTMGTVTAGGETIPTTGTAPTKTVAPGSTVTVTASSATAGTILTCKIVNSSGDIVGYGQGSNTSLTLNAKNLSGANLAVGSYTIYVWAQKNNDKISHEGSSPRYFTLKVAPPNAAPPTIGTQPTGASYVQGVAATPLTVTATVSDGGTLSYQWYSNTANSTSNSTSLTATAAKTASYTPPTTTVGTRYYYCIVTNTNNNAINKTATATSTIVAITVNTRVDAATPVIGTQPVGANYTQGATATPLTVAATASDGGTLSYQWYSNTTNSTSGGASLGADNGARTAGYTPSTATGGTKYYYCVVTNTNNSVNGTRTATATSNTAEVTVTAGLHVNGGDLLTALADVKNAIVSALSSNATATVTGGLSGVTETLTLTIPAGKTVVWQANLEGSAATLVNISGGGTLDVAAGGLLKTSGKSETIAVGANTTVKVSSGTVDATNNSIAEAIYLNGTGARAEVTGGEVKAVSTGIECRDGGIVSVSGGTVSSSAVNGSAIDVYGASTVEISGNATVTSAAGFAINVNHRSTAVVSIKGGTVTGQNPIEGGSIIVSGGALSGTNTGAIMLSNNANAFILGGTITAGGSVPISRITSVTTHTGAAYYIGERAALFNDTFTPGTNLFKFDGAPALTANGAAYTYNGTTPSAYPVVAALWVQWLDLRGATVTASAGNPTVNTTERTVTFDKTVNDPAITLTVTGAKIGGTNIPFDFTTAAFGVNTTGVGLSVNGGNLLTALADIKNAIESALSSNATATVTGALSGVTADLTLTIPAGKTVAWQADYSGSNRVYINGSGTFEIASGGNITSSHNSYALTSGNASVIVKTGGGVENTGSGGTAIYVQENASLTVDGGTVSAQSRAINANGNATATVKSGTVESAGSDAITISSNATLAIEGGTVRNTGLTTSVVIIYDNSTVFVSGGTIAAGGIQRNASAVSATGYYTGANSAAFKMDGTNNFTATNLFQLDALTIQPAYNSETPSETPVVATLSDKLNLTNATVTASAGNPAVNKAAKTVTFNQPVNNPAITIAVTGAKIAGTNIPVSFTTAAFGVNVAGEVGLRVNGSNLLTDVTTIQTAITNALNTSNVTVTVTGALSGVTTDLILTIPAGKTVAWQADYSGNNKVLINGSGTFEITGGGKITSSNSDEALYLYGEASVLVGAGGVVENTYATGNAIIVDANASLAITGGTVRNTNASANVVRIYGNSTVFVSGGTIAAGGIQRNASAPSAKGYYIGDRQGLFNTTSGNKFTFGTNLFQLDTYTLNAAYNSTTPSSVPVVATLSAKLDLSNATVTASAGDPTIDKAANTVTFDKIVDNAAITIEVTGAKITGTDIPVSFTTAAFGVNVDPSTFTLTLAKGRNWYLSSPVAAAKANTAFAAAGFVEYYDEPRTTPYSASESTMDGWVNIAGSANTLVPGKGYVVYAEGEGEVTYTFTGIPNTGDVEVPLTRTADVTKEGFNLVGNPYLSYIDWDEVSSVNGSVVEPTIWYRTKTDAYQFYTYSSESGLSDPVLEYPLQYIPPMQGFWVRANNAAGTFKFTEDAKRSNETAGAGNGNILRQATGNQRPLVRLQLADGGKTDRAVIFADKNAKDGFDRYDSGKMFSSDAAIYTVAGNEKLIFNGLSAISAGTEIALGFSTGHSGEYSIAAIAVQDLDGFDVILKDNSQATEFSLTDGEAYRFTSGITDNTSRFSVILREQKSVTDVVPVNGEVSVYASNNTLYVQSPVAVKQVRVYNLVGKLLYSTKESVINNVSSGICIVKVETENGTVSRKVIVN